MGQRGAGRCLHGVSSMNDLRTNKEWIFWGEHDPLFAVTTRQGKDIGGEAPWTAEEFLATGDRYFADVYRQWQQYGVGSDHCVEIGCGSGRITRPLLRRFNRVTAVDVSPAQLENARRLLGDDARRVTFTLVSQPALPVDGESCDGVFSCEVFQHFDSETPLAAYLRDAARVLKPNGTICFQVPVRGVSRRSFLSSRVRHAALRLARKLGRRRMMIYRQYDASTILHLLVQNGFCEPEMRVFRAAEQEGMHAYFLAKKPAP